MGGGRGRGGRPPAAGGGRTLTGLGRKGQAVQRIQPVEAAEARRGGGLVRPVQVAVVPEAAYEEKEPPRTLSGEQERPGHSGWETLGPAGLPCLMWKTLPVPRPQLFFFFFPNRKALHKCKRLLFWNLWPFRRRVRGRSWVFWVSEQPGLKFTPVL